MLTFSILVLLFTLGSIILTVVKPKAYHNLIRVYPLYLGATVVLWALLLFSCLENIKPGEIGVLVNMLGNEKGVEDKELTVGMHVISPWKSLYKFPTFEQNHQWVGEEGFSFQTAEGLIVTADIGITFNLVPTRIHELFCKYRRGMDEITHLFIRNNIRDAINRVSSKMTIEELYGNKKEEFFTEVKKLVQHEIESLGFHISHLYIIGRFGVPENVMAALNKKIESIQRAQQRENELRETEAEAKKKIAQTEGEARSKLIRGEADAEYNRKITSTLTPSLLQYNYIQKWDGKMPYAVGGDKAPMIMSLPLPRGE